MFQQLVPCPVDLNGDRNVNNDDIFIVLDARGPCGDCPEDLNSNGVANVDDAIEVLADWGPCP